MALNYITKDVTITVNGSTATLDEPLYFYQFDRNIDILFTIKNFKFDFFTGTQQEVNMINAMNASYATIRVLKPDTVPEVNRRFVSDTKLPLENGKVIFTVTPEFIDEIEEIGVYKLQISLYDSQDGKITIPPINFEVLEPIFPDDYTEEFTAGQIDISRIGMSRIASDSGVSALGIMNGDSTNEWAYGQIIDAHRMNWINDSIYELKDALGTSGGETDASNVTYNNGTYTTVQEALDSLLYVPLSVSSFSMKLGDDTYNGNAIVEMGRRFESATTLTWSYNKPISSITSQVITCGGTPSTANGLTHSYNSPITSNTSFTITGSDGKKSASRTINITYYNKIYYGVSSSTTYDSSLFIQMTGVLSNNVSRTINVNAGEGEYVYYIFPSRLSGSPIFSVGGFVGGFSKVATYSFSNIYGYTENYDIYRSANTNLGNVQVEIK